MREEIIANIMRGLSEGQDHNGNRISDKFDSLSITDFGMAVYNAIPLYIDENIELVLEHVLAGITTTESKLLYIKKHIRWYAHKFALNTISEEMLTAYAFWVNVLNKFLYQAEIVNNEIEYKNYLFSHLIGDIKSLNKEVNLNPIQASSVPVGDYFIRVKYVEDDPSLIPTSKTNKEFNKYFNP